MAWKPFGDRDTKTDELTTLCGEAESREAHNLEIAGSNPATANVRSRVSPSQTSTLQPAGLLLAVVVSGHGEPAQRGEGGSVGCAAC